MVPSPSPSPQTLTIHDGRLSLLSLFRRLGRGPGDPEPVFAPHFGRGRDTFRDSSDLLVCAGRLPPRMHAAGVGNEGAASCDVTRLFTLSAVAR